jgi:hypothetical protein
MASLALLQRRITRALVREDIEAEEMTAWVASAATRINRELRVKENLRHKVLPLTANKFQMPPDYLHHHDIRLAANPTGGAIDVGFSRGALAYVPPAEFSALSGGAYYPGQRPGVFTTHGSEFEIAPWVVTPGALQISLWYFAKLTPLVNPTDTNDVLENFQDLYLSAALIYGHRFYLEDDKALIKDGLVTQEIRVLNENFTDAKFGDGPLIARPTRKIGGRYS